MLDKFTKNGYFYNVYIGVLFLLAATVVVTKTQVMGAVAFGCIAALAIALFSDLTAFLIPTMFLSVFVTVCYDSYSTFIKFLPLAVPLAACIVFSFVKYGFKIKPGPNLRGAIAVAIAVTLGGIGWLPAKSYFSGKSIFYVFMLGIGMVLLYLLFTARLTDTSGIVIAKMMYAVGLLAAFVVFFNFYNHWDVFANERKFPYFPPSNNLSTFMMLALPFPMYFARKNSLHVLSSFAMYIATAVSSSRGGFVMGTVEMGILLICYMLFFEKRILNKLIYGAAIAGGIAAIYYLLPEMILRISDKSLMFAPEKPVFSQTIELASHYFFDDDEARVIAMKQCIKDFLKNPLFGTGIGNTTNTNVYIPRAGAMNWYHMWTAQIIGSMGTVGILAYGYQLFIRAKTYFRNRSPLNMTLFLSYIGLWLMSQINPGEFCPIPYALMATVYFAIIERKSYGTAEADSNI